jgi:DNA recombination protein RmuC
MIFIGLTIGIIAGAILGYLLAARSNADAVLRMNAAEASLALKDELLRTQAENHERQIELMKSDRKQLSEEMTTISSEVLSRTSKQLSAEFTERQKLEREQAKNELEKRTVEIRTAVTPVTEKLAEVQQKVESLEKERVKAQGELGEQLKVLKEGVGSLAKEAGGLTAALRKPMGRGSWGEVQLRNVIELAGMVEHCDFKTQFTVEGDNGRLRPDVIVNMPGGQTVVVDAKAPMEAFLEAQEEADEEKRQELLARHARHVRDHINTLRTKDYQSQFETSPELVVMFVPSEGLYHAALAEDSLLLEHGLTEKVLIATPTTLIGLLRAINYGWGQDTIARSAQEIAAAGKELHKRILTFAEPLHKVGKSLNTAADNYNKAVRSYESRIVPQLKRLEDSGAQSPKEIEPSPTVDTVAQSIAIEAAAAPEDAGSIEEDAESGIQLL